MINPQTLELLCAIVTNGKVLDQNVAKLHLRHPKVMAPRWREFIQSLAVNERAASSVLGAGSIALAIDARQAGISQRLVEWDESGDLDLLINDYL